MSLGQVFGRLPDPQSHAFPDYSLPRGESVLPIAVTRDELTAVLELYDAFQRVDPTGIDANPFLEAATTYMQQAFGLPDYRARNATQAVLSALGERLDEDLSQHLDGQLPDEIGDHLVEGASERRFDYDEFLERVEERTDRAAVGDPERLVDGVVGTLLEHVDDEHAERLRERLEELDFGAAIPESGPGARN